MNKTNRQAIANLSFLKRLFSIPKDDKATLNKLEKVLSENLDKFLSDKKVAGKIPLIDLSKKYNQFSIPVEPRFVSEHVDYLLEEVIPYSVHTMSPKFIGHMTSAIPYFLQSLSKCMVALHQNVVKIETSRAFTFLEKQTLGMLHHLIYKENESFYNSHVHSRKSTLGIQCSGGTIANISALWVARNQFIQKILGDKAHSGNLIEAISKSQYKNLCIFVSQRAHYSFFKAADILGIGRENIKYIPVDSNHRLSIEALNHKIQESKSNNLYPLAVIGIAGTTETGSIDPLDEIANICEKEKIYYHVDAAWGGAALLSNTNKEKLKGIDRADSVTVDGHKQLYLPMGVGMLLFKDPTIANYIEMESQYVIRKGSFDLGRRSLEGSRPGMALLAHAALNIFGQKGYELIIDQGIKRAEYFANYILNHNQFELINQPDLNIFTYRFHPIQLIKKISSELNDELSLLNKKLQKAQRKAGNSFVSRTSFRHPEPNGHPIIVLRVVLANPLTDESHLENILEEQVETAQTLLRENKKLFPIISAKLLSS